MTYTKNDYGARSVAWQESIEGVCIKYGKLYGYPAQKTILSLGDKYHQVKCSMRTLNRDLKKMESQGRFRRLRRITRNGINMGRFMSTLYILGRSAFKSASKMKKAAERVLSLCRLPNLANNKSQRENDIFKEVATHVEKLWNSPSEGGPTPLESRRVGHQGHLEPKS